MIRKPIFERTWSFKIVKDAYLIRVALELADGNPGRGNCQCSGSLVPTYNSEYQRGRNSTLRASLITEQGRIDKEIEVKRAELSKLVNKGHIVPLLDLNNKIPKDDSEPLQPTFSKIPDGTQQRLADEMVNTDLEIIKIESDLSVSRAEIEAEERDGALLSKRQEEQREQQIRDDFRKDPEVIALSRRDCPGRRETGPRQRNSTARARPSSPRSRKDLPETDGPVRGDLWKVKYEDFSARLKTAAVGDSFAGYYQ